MWSKRTLDQANTYHWRIGKKEIWLQKKDLEWRYAMADVAEAVEGQVMGNVYDGALEEREWQSAISEKSNALQVLPAMPDMPLVIKPKTKFTVLAGKSVVLYVPVPYYLQFYAGSKKKENLIFESPTEAFSQTWFGEFHNGQLAYSWELDLSAHLSMNKGAVNHVICPVKLINDSHSVLEVQRLLLHCEFLTLYGKDDELITNEIKIKFKGESDMSDVQYGSQAPTIANHKGVVCAARVSKLSSVLSKSFHFIKTLSNY